MQIDISKLISRLEKPTGMVDVVLDTDTFNEIDDQFALAYLIQSEEKLRLKAVYAAPFYNHHSESPADGMERSYHEIFKIFDLIKEDRYRDLTFRGADSFLPSETEAVDSDAARDLIDKAMNHSEENPLYVIGIAAATNIASAIIMKPEIISRIVVLWKGGYALDWPDNKSFNSGQDVAASRVLLDSGVPLVQIPGMGVTNHFLTTGPEMEYWLRGKNTLCDYLIDIAANEAKICYGGKVWSRPIFDVVPIAWLLDGDFMLDRLEHSPIMQYNHRYSFDNRRHFIKYVYCVHRDNLMQDLFSKLARFK